MPSYLHQALVEILREQPDLLLGLCAPKLTRLAPHDKIVTDSRDVGPAKPTELQADGVLRLEHEGRTQSFMILEVQLRRDPDKAFSWPAYLANARVRYRCDGILVVVTPIESVARWARKPVPLGINMGYLQPFVLGPSDFPILEQQQAFANPALATLSAIAHARDPDPKRAAALAHRAIVAALALPPTDRHAQLYYDLIIAALSREARKAFEMIPNNYQYRDKGLRRAKAEGIAEGKAEGLAEAIIDVFQARGLSVSDEQRKQIFACENVDQLRKWLATAIVAASVADALRG